MNRNRYIHGAILAICTAIGAPTATAQERKIEDLATRLVKLEQRLEEERTKLHLPGLAIAVVHGDKIIFAKGLGHRDLEKQLPVTPQTLFAIGSTTKAFTASLIGMLSDDAKMSFDDPVDKHIPAFRLDIDTGDEKATVRDLLSHRTGFTRMGALWAGGRLSRSEVFAMVARAKPYAAFRKKFLYNNVMYMTAGHAAGLAGESDWASLVAERIFKPLKMRSSSTSITVARKDARMAKGYIWQEHSGKHVRKPMRNLDLVGPAGSINSNVEDMAQWIRFQLGRGKFEGKQLLRAKTLAETWEPQMRMAPGVDYGLGWMLRDWNGAKVVEHGGSIDGFAAQVSLLPEHDLGYVLLTNVTATPLQQKSIDVVFSTLLGNATAVTNAKQDDVGGLPGKYVANFATWRDARFTVVQKSGVLSIDVPGQRVFELKPPDAKGKRYFALTDTIAVSFQRDAAGKPTSLTMHQSGFDFECPREGVAVPIEVPLEQLQPLLGTYRDEQRQREMKVVIVNNRLAVEEPGGGLFELRPPEGYERGKTPPKGRWALRANKSRAQFLFNFGEDGSTRSMTRFQKGRAVEMPRVAEGAGSSLPTVEALIARMHKAYGASKLAAFGEQRLTGEVTFIHQGVRGKTIQLISGSSRFTTHLDLGKLGQVRVAYDGKRGWQDSDFAEFSELGGVALRQLEYKDPLWVLRDWRKTFGSAAIVGMVKVEGEPAYRLKLSGKGVPGRTIVVSAKSSLVLVEKTVEISPGIGQFPITLTYGDFRRVNGVMVPFRIASENVQMGQIVIQFERAERVDNVLDDAFRLSPRPATARSGK